MADIWLTNPTYDAHLFVIVEEAQKGHVFLLNKMSDAVISHIQAKAADFTVVARRPVASMSTAGEHILGSGTIRGTKLMFHYGVFALGRHGFQILCSASPKTFEHVAATCENVIESFTYEEKSPQAPV